MANPSLSPSALAKPIKGSAAKAKRREKRLEAAVAKAVRAACVARDGYCLIATRLPRSMAVLLGRCEGPSEWAHVGEHRRCHTRGMEPEQRHTTAGSGMLCRGHHVAYDSHEFDFLMGVLGMDGAGVAVIRRAA